MGQFQKNLGFLKIVGIRIGNFQVFNGNPLGLDLVTLVRAGRGPAQKSEAMSEAQTQFRANCTKLYFIRLQTNVSLEWSRGRRPESGILRSLNLER